MKLNVLLAVTDSLKVKFKGMVNDYTKFFDKSQTAFKGVKNTYEPREGTIDEPTKRGIQLVVTTVDEKIQYFVNESKEFINALFSQEKTNASGVCYAPLIVDGENWGTFTSLELLRLKSLLESSDIGDIQKMIENIPVRTEAEVWEKNTNPEYSGRDIWQTALIRNVVKTTEKEQYILPDPNVQSGNAKTYTPQIGVKNTIKELGDSTTQKFSGEWSHKERAFALKRKNDLLVACVRALKECNECEVVESTLTAEKIWNYIFYGK